MGLGGWGAASGWSSRVYIGMWICCSMATQTTLEKIYNECTCLHKHMSMADLGESLYLPCSTCGEVKLCFDDCVCGTIAHLNPQQVVDSVKREYAKVKHLA